MAKRQLRIPEIDKIVDKKSLVGSLSTFCIFDNRVIFGTIIDYRDGAFLVKDKLLKTHSFSIQEISEIIIEKDEIVTEGSNKIC